MTNNTEDEPAINSEVIWTFNNVKSQLLDAYPNGKALTENLITVDGFEWLIEFYPNGNDQTSDGKIHVRLTLKNIKTGETAADAECNYYLIMKSLNKNYVGKISRRNFKPEICEEDSDFDNSLLKECESDCLITFNVSQFEKAPTPSPPPQPQPQVVDEQQQQQQQENLIENDTNLLSNSNETQPSPPTPTTTTVTNDENTFNNQEDSKKETVQQLY